MLVESADAAAWAANADAVNSIAAPAFFDFDSSRTEETGAVLLESPATGTTRARFAIAPSEAQFAEVTPPKWHTLLSPVKRATTHG